MCTWPRQVAGLWATVKLMTLDFAIRHWALIVASVLGAGVLLFVLGRLYADSARGRLHYLSRQLRRQKRVALRAERKYERARQRFAGLKRREQTVKPMLLNAADEAMQDARMLQQLADDLVLVAQRKLRDLIIEEFPPNRHDRLRNRYL